MDDSKIIDALGGTTEVARLCKVRPPSVSGWRVNGIPPARRQYLELLRPEAFGGGPLDEQGDGLASAGVDVKAAQCGESESGCGDVHGNDARPGMRPAA